MRISVPSGPARFSAFSAPPVSTSPFGVAQSRDYDGVPKTIGDMRSMVADALLREQSIPLRKLCEEITARVRPKDYLSEVAAIYYWVLANVRYVRDPVHVEFVQHPLVLLQPQAWDRAAGRRGRADDCEALSTTLAAMVMCIGNAAQFVTVSTQPGQGFHHVFATATMPDGMRVVLDPVPGPAVNRMLASVKSYQIWPIEPVRMAGRPGWGVAGGPAMAGVGLPPVLSGSPFDKSGLGLGVGIASPSSINPVFLPVSHRPRVHELGVR